LYAVSDEVLAQAVDAFRLHGTKQAAADALGWAVGTFKHRLNLAEAKERVDPAITAGMEAVGTGLVPSGMWIKTGKDDAGVSRSIYLRPAPEDSEDVIERIKTAFEGIEPAEPVIAPQAVLDDLCTVYPVMDLHLGMQAWGRETGNQDYDLALACQDMRYAFAKVLELVPASREAVLILGGDTLHADDDRAETPTSKHKLDVDGRQFKVIDTAIAILAETIERLLAKHSSVHVRVLRGNHDTHSHMVLTFALCERYRNEPRVSVDKDPRDLYMKQWGRSAIFAHHGDKAKPDRMALYISDVCPFWSETRHRHYFVGHVHHDHAKDIGPLRYESLRAFCPPDSYAAGMGYGARRALQAVTFHKQDGLVLRALDPIERLAA
jgi:hypothetical protein